MMGPNSPAGAQQQQQLQTQPPPHLQHPQLPVPPPAGGQVSQQQQQQQPGGGPPPPPQAFFPHYPILPMLPPPGNYFNIGQHHHVQAPCVQPRRKNATRETTMMLKHWLNNHKRNPYPTKNEKIFLAVVTCMSLTQVSTWFANARRRLKKENKMTWSPRNRCDEDDDDDDNDDEPADDDDDQDQDDMDQRDQDDEQQLSLNLNQLTGRQQDSECPNEPRELRPNAPTNQHPNQQHPNLNQMNNGNLNAVNLNQQDQLQTIIHHNLHHNLQAHLQSHMLGQFQHQHQQHLSHLQQLQQASQLKLLDPASLLQSHQPGPLQQQQLLKLDQHAPAHQLKPTNSNIGHAPRPASGEPAKSAALWRPFM